MVHLQLLHEVFVDIRVVELALRALENPDYLLVGDSMAPLDLDDLGNVLATQVAQVLRPVHFEGAKEADF